MPVLDTTEDRMRKKRVTNGMENVFRTNKKVTLEIHWFSTSKLGKKKKKSLVWSSGGLGFSEAYKKLLPVPGGVSRNVKQTLPAVVFEC